MKKLIVLIAFCVTAFTYAQGPPHEAKDLSATERAGLQTKKMTLALALDTAQSKKAYTVILSQVEKHMVAKETRKERAEDQIPSKEEHLKRMNMRLDSKIAFQNEMKTILTITQFEQWRKIAKKGEMNKKKKPRWSQKRSQYAS
jgi:protein CpxP